MRIVLALLSVPATSTLAEHLAGKVIADFVINKLNRHQHPFTTRFLYQIGIFPRQLTETVQQHIAFCSA